jgi:1-acyl-sn-glycerol-3-phosphate acyltransferase
VLYELIYGAIQSGAHLLCRSLFRVRRVGASPALPEGGVLLCPNHESYLDPPFVQLVVPRRVTFVMTNDFYRSPVANWFFRLVGALPVGMGADARHSIRRATALLRSGATVVLFPEGRLSKDGRLQRGQRGVAILARRAGVPVIPVAIHGSRRAWPKGSRYPHPANVRISFGAPVAWRGDGGRDAEQAFADRVMAHVAAQREALETSAR